MARSPSKKSTVLFAALLIVIAVIAIELDIFAGDARRGAPQPSTAELAEQRTRIIGHVRSTAYEEYFQLSSRTLSAATSSPPWNKERFAGLFARFYIPHGLYMYELKIFPKKLDQEDGILNISVRSGLITLTSDPQSTINILVLRDPFEDPRSWALTFAFTIKNYPKLAPQDGAHPAFLTFSDELHAGFLALWPERLEYYDLGPYVTKANSWKLPNPIGGREVMLELRKAGDGRLTIRLDGLDVSQIMGGSQIAGYNYEIPPFVRYTTLNGSANSLEEAASKTLELPPDIEPSGYKKTWHYAKTRNFIRFGTVHYPALGETYPRLSVRELNIESPAAATALRRTP